MFFIAAGVTHFVLPQPYLAIMPLFVPWPETMVSLSGFAEVLGGIAVLFAPTRRAASWGLIALLIAVFPANIYAAIHGMSLAGWEVPAWLLWLRLPMQPALIAWVYLVCRSASFQLAR